MVDLVDFGEIRELAWSEPGLGGKEAPIPRLRTEPSEQRGNTRTVTRIDGSQSEATGVG